MFWLIHVSHKFDSLEITRSFYNQLLPPPLSLFSSFLSPPPPSSSAQWCSLWLYCSHCSWVWSVSWLCSVSGRRGGWQPELEMLRPTSSCCTTGWLIMGATPPHLRRPYMCWTKLLAKEPSQRYWRGVPSREKGMEKWREILVVYKLVFEEKEKIADGFCTWSSKSTWCWKEEERVLISCSLQVGVWKKKVGKRVNLLYM